MTRWNFKMNNVIAIPTSNHSPMIKFGFLTLSFLNISDNMPIFTKQVTSFLNNVPGGVLE